MTKRNLIPNHLDSNCKNFPCCNGLCGDAIKLNRGTLRYFITMGHPGFNSTANNGAGYPSYGHAYAALRKYGRKAA